MLDNTDNSCNTDNVTGNPFSHIDGNGNMKMVDVGHKPATKRIAVACSTIKLAKKTYGLLKTQALPKGDALAAAKVGAILAAKRTAELIPLCHTLPLTNVDVKFEYNDTLFEIKILATAQCIGQTGVEMEAIIASQIGAAIIYDMCKAVQKDIIITDTKLLYKNGGKSGEFKAPEWHE